MLLQWGALLRVVGLAATWQDSHILCRHRPSCSSTVFHFLLILPIFHGFVDSVLVHFSLSDPPPLPFSLFICLNPLIPRPLYICLPVSPSSSLTLLPPNHSHHSLVKRGGKQALVFDRQVLSADISPRSTLSLAKPGRVEWQPAFSGRTFRLWSSPEVSLQCVCVCIPTHLRTGLSDTNVEVHKRL